MKGQKIYSVNDIEILAYTILNNWEDHHSQSRHLCNYCSGERFKKGVSTIPSERTGNYDEWEHSIDCPCLIAQDVLTKER